MEPNRNNNKEQIKIVTKFFLVFLPFFFLFFFLFTNKSQAALTCPPRCIYNSGPGCGGSYEACLCPPEYTPPPTLCPTPTPTPAPTASCPGTGVPSSGWGGSCSPAGTQTKLACDGPGHCSVAACQQYSGSTYCWYNSGVCYNDPVSCSSIFNGYSQTSQTCNSQGQWSTTGTSCVLSCATPTPTPTLAPPPTYTISGNVFVDTNKDTFKNNGETNYTGSITISSTGGFVTTFSGLYTISGLNAGIYTVSYTNLPTGYSMTYPVNGPPPSFTVTVGGACSAGGSNSASCSGGSIVNLNFGITNSNPWIQIIGNDARIDSGFNDSIPQGASCGSYASIPGSQNSPGIIFSGASSYTFGQGQASQNPYNWVVGGLTYPESYGPLKNGSLVKTGFSYLQSKASQAGLTITDISTYCSGGITNCTLSASIPHGVYIANGSMALVGSGFTFPSGQNYVILVNGDLTFKEKVLVPNGSTAVFSASGNINVDKSIGESSFSSTASDLEGIYSADKNFIVQGTNNCSTGADLRLNIAGAVITNAAGGGGSFQNQRDLCGGNVSCPAFSSIARPDLILNTPSFMKQANFTYQEIAP